MDLFSQIRNLYTNTKSDWMEDINDTEIQPFIINRFLAMNSNVRLQARWLDKYVFSLPPKMYLSLAWSVVPKQQKAPFVRYIKKKKDTEDEFDFILHKVRKQFCLSDNDYESIKDRLTQAIKSDMATWFRYYGIEKKYWKRHTVDFKQIKDRDVKDTKIKQWF